MIRLVTAALLGALIAAALVGFFTKETGYLNATIVLGVLFALSLFAGVFGAANAITARPAEGSQFALARVLGLRETGTRVNNQPVCELDLLVVPDDDPAYRTTIRGVLSIASIARLASGATLVVAIADPARPEVSIVASPPAEWAQRAGHATFPEPSAVPVREPVTRPLSLFGSVPTAMSVIAFVAGAAIALVPYPFV